MEIEDLIIECSQTCVKCGAMIETSIVHPDGGRVNICFNGHAIYEPCIKN